MRVRVRVVVGWWGGAVVGCGGGGGAGVGEESPVSSWLAYLALQVAYIRGRCHERNMYNSNMRKRMRYGIYSCQVTRMRALTSSGAYTGRVGGGGGGGKERKKGKRKRMIMGRKVYHVRSHYLYTEYSKSFMLYKRSMLAVASYTDRHLAERNRRRPTNHNGMAASRRPSFSFSFLRAKEIF